MKKKKLETKIGLIFKAYIASLARMSDVGCPILLPLHTPVKHLAIRSLKT